MSRDSDSDAAPFQFDNFLVDDMDDIPSPPLSAAKTSSSEVDPDNSLDNPPPHIFGTIPESFIRYYNHTYKVVYPECCTADSSAPWEGLDTDDDRDIDELFSRFIHFLAWSLQKFWSNENRAFEPVTGGMVEDWMDVCFARTRHELRCNGQSVRLLVVDDVWVNYKCLYRRLDDWVQAAIDEHGLERSPRPDPSEDGSIHSEEGSIHSGNASDDSGYITQDFEEHPVPFPLFPDNDDED